MFEQTFIECTGTRRPWTYFLGVIGELLALGVLILLPLIYTDKLTRFGISHLPLITPHPAPPRPPPVKMDRAVTRVARVFKPAKLVYAPRSIPEKALMLVDDIDTTPGTFVPNAVAGSGDGAGIPLGGPPPLGVPPLNKPVERPAATAPKPIPERIRVGGDVQAARIVRRILPVYPALARQMRVQGTVRLLGIIARDGSIQQLQVISGHALLVQAAVDAVRQWIYKPTQLNGEPVEVIAPIEVHFSLN